MAKILNTFLCAFAVFFLCFAWIYYSLKDDVLAVALSLIVAISTLSLLWIATSRFDAGKKIKLAQKNAVSSLVNYLRFGLDNATLFCDLMQYYRFSTTKVDCDALIATKNGQSSYVAICFAHDKLSSDELRNAVISAKRAACNRLYVFTTKVDSSLIAVANSHVTTTVIDAQNTYTLFEQSSKLPSIPQQKAPKKASFVANYAFNRKRFGWYFASSLFMLLISFIAYFPWYTLAWSTVFFALAVYSLVNRRFNVPPTRVTLD